MKKVEKMKEAQCCYCRHYLYCQVDRQWKCRHGNGLHILITKRTAKRRGLSW